MSARFTKTKLLAGTSALALVALSSTQAFAAYGPGTSPVTTALTASELAGANADTFTVSGAGSVIVTNGIAVDANGKTGLTFTVNTTSTTSSLQSTGDFSTISVTGAGSTTTAAGGIVITSGTVDGASTSATKGTIAINGVAATSKIDVAAAGTISNTGTGGNIIYIGATGANATTITNLGTIIGTNNASTVGINVADLAGNIVTIANSGTINAGALGTAIKAGAGANSQINVTQTLGTITGAINLGSNTNAATSLAVNGGTVNGNVTMGAAGQVLTLGGGQVNGTIDGPSAITLTAGNTGTGNNTYVANGAIGATTAVTTLTVNNGKTFTTTGAIKTTGGTILGSGGAGATLNVGAGVITGGIQAQAAGFSTVNFTDNQVLGAGGIGNLTKLATINITDSKTLDASASTGGISATNINVGTSTAGATLKVGAEALTGIVDSGSAGTSTLTFTGNSTIGAGTTIGATNGFATVNINDGAAVDNTNGGVIKATNVVLGSTTGVGSTLTLGTGAVTGAISTVVTNQGVLNIAASNTIGGKIGAAGKVLNAVNITGGTTTLGANSIYATKTAISAGATLALTTGSVNGDIDGAGGANGTVTVAGNQTTTGALGLAAGNGLAAVTINSGTLSLGEAAGDIIKATTTTVNTGGTLNFGNTARTTNAGNIVGAGTGTINLGTQSQTLTAGIGAGNLTTAAGGQTVDIGVRDGTANDNGKISLAGIAVVDASTLLHVDTSATTSYIASGTAYKWLASTGVNNSAVLAGANVSASSPLFTAAETVVAGAGGSRTVTLTRVAGGYAGVATTTDTQSVGTALEALGVAATTDTNIAAFLGKLDQSSSAAVLTNALKQVQPQVNATSTQAIADTTQSLNVVETRLDQLHAGIDSSENGMAAGGKVADKGIWFQAFGSSGTQNLRSGVDGYDATTGGGAVGADMAINDKTRAGLSVSYAKTTVDSNGSAIQSTDIDSYQVNAYGSYNISNHWFADGLLGFAYQDYNSERTITAPSLIADGSFSGQTYTARATTGYRFDAAKGFDLTPNAGLTYFYNHVSGYTETNAGGLDLNVGSNNTQALIGRIGADLGYNYQYGSTLIRPVVRAGYSYDFVGDQVSTTSTFTGGGATFNTKDASVERSAFDVGASLNIVRTNNVTFSADYDYLKKSDFDSHSGVLRARINF